MDMHETWPVRMFLALACTKRHVHNLRQFLVMSVEIFAGLYEFGLSICYIAIFRQGAPLVVVDEPHTWHTQSCVFVLTLSPGPPLRLRNYCACWPYTGHHAQQFLVRGGEPGNKAVVVWQWTVQKRNRICWYKWGCNRGGWQACAVT